MAKKPIRIYIQSSSIESQAVHQFNRALAGEATRISDPCVLKHVLQIVQDSKMPVEVVAYWTEDDMPTKPDTPLRRVDQIDIACRLGGTAVMWRELLAK